MYTRILLIGALLVASLGYLLAGRSSTDAAPKQPPIQGRNKTVLFLTNADEGLSNVHVATTYSLLENYPDIEVHYASFAKARKKVEWATSFARKKTPAARDVVFHELHGLSMVDALNKRGYNLSTCMQPPGMAGIGKFARDVQLFVAPWGAEEHLDLYRQMGALIDEVDPAVVVLDYLFRPALDATWDKNRLHAIVTPNPLVDSFLEVQPWGGMLWKYPSVSSGFPFPVPLRKIPENIYLNFRFLWSIIAAPDLAEKKAVLLANGITNPMSLVGLHHDDAPFITMHTEGADIPVDIIPVNVTVAGPIVLSSAPAATQDPELAAWLKRGPTMLINLGSVVKYDQQRAVAMSLAIVEVLAKTGAQVLWKYRKLGDYPDGAVLSILQPHIDSGRLRVSSWLTVDPLALLETGDIAAFVHHGGSSCYHEGIAAGVPQVVLPLWVDLYGFAALAEGSGVGFWACKESSPAWTPECLGAAFIEILSDGPANAARRQKAKQLGDAVQAKEKGRDIAAREVAKLAYVR